MKINLWWQNNNNNNECICIYDRAYNVNSHFQSSGVPPATELYSFPPTSTVNLNSSPEFGGIERRETIPREEEDDDNHSTVELTGIDTVTETEE
jgi:hypothetical protein